MERRRFFPSRPSQQGPGQRVELEVQLRPEAVVPVAEPVAEPAAEPVMATWLPFELLSKWMQYPSGGVAVEVEPGKWELTHPWASQYRSTRWVGAPYMVGGVPAPQPSREWRCVWAEVDGGADVCGAVLEATSADWSLTWADPDPSGSPDGDGYYVSDEGDAAIARQAWLIVHTTSGSGGGGSDVLTADASVGGADAGRIQLKVIYGEW